eukprot:CAMPEP_0185852702 /NCGR_PEP_ID=MMETSP1354-20130828/15875_1 /TAXON_ID=708628 /ORGANISM="Erythrolobus madagascarensis, Strain CCMP3276" /LENGTH=84 /DNA_ID=CAMNT_0028554015 /DNA_START=21 /DNA_END=272 /DNA_ORIENTATION=+
MKQKRSRLDAGRLHMKDQALSVAGGSDKSAGTSVRNVGVVVLAGGVGSRMKADRPKQFLELRGKSIVERSLDVFLEMPEVSRVV